MRPAVATGGLGLGGTFSLSAALLSGCEIPGIGFIDADTVQALLTVVPTDIGRALLDARTGTLMETVTTAYRPSKNVTEFVTTRDGTCRMWGCPRPAVKCDIDHARPWPTGPTTPTNLGGLCRRHHRLKQQRRWTYQLAPDGTATWTSPTGSQTHHAARPRRPPTTGDPGARAALSDTNVSSQRWHRRPSEPPRVQPQRTSACPRASGAGALHDHRYHRPPSHDRRDPSHAPAGAEWHRGRRPRMRERIDCDRRHPGTRQPLQTSRPPVARSGSGAEMELWACGRSTRRGRNEARPVGGDDVPQVRSGRPPGCTGGSW